MCRIGGLARGGFGGNGPEANNGGAQSHEDGETRKHGKPGHERLLYFLMFSAKWVPNIIPMNAAIVYRQLHPHNIQSPATGAGLCLLALLGESLKAARGKIPETKLRGASPERLPGLYACSRSLALGVTGRASITALPRLTLLIVWVLWAFFSSLCQRFLLDFFCGFFFGVLGGFWGRSGPQTRL